MREKEKVKVIAKIINDLAVASLYSGLLLWTLANLPFRGGPLSVIESFAVTVGALLALISGAVVIITSIIWIHKEKS